MMAVLYRVFALEVDGKPALAFKARSIRSSRSVQRTCLLNDLSNRAQMERKRWGAIELSNGSGGGQPQQKMGAFRR